MWNLKETFEIAHKYFACTLKYMDVLKRWKFLKLLDLTHWGRVTYIGVSKLTIIGSDNGLSPDRRQAII